MKHHVLLGDPSHFRIKVGANPHTRNAWGFKKKVDGNRAMRQWAEFRDTLERLGAVVHVMAGSADHPGSVFTANAGFVHPKYIPGRPHEKKFILSRLTAARAGEEALVRLAITPMGFQIVQPELVLEGEADFFPAGNRYIFTFGESIQPHWAWRWGVPPYRRVFGFRSDVHVLPFLQKIAGPHSITLVRLTDERYYHGDTVFCAFGPARENLMVWFGGIEARSATHLREQFSKSIISLSPPDARVFAANSFQLDTDRERYLLMPSQAGLELKRQVAALGVQPVEVDVSEFFEKGGGSIKCLVCDLGWWPD